MMRRTVAVVALWIPIAGGRECGVRNAECGVTPPTDIPHSTFRIRHSPLTIARLHYDGGGDWYANPSSLPNLLAAVRERTALSVAPRERVVRLTDADLWDLPYLYMTGHGNVVFSDAEVVLLRRYLEQGGFLHADDNYGMDQAFRREVARVFPDHPLVLVPFDHPVYHLVYEFPDGLPKIHEHDGKPAQGFGVFLAGRLVVYYSYESDLGDGWEDPEVHQDPADRREAALRMGVNLVAYAVGATR
jgi:hypothetical protein